MYASIKDDRFQEIIGHILEFLKDKLEWGNSGLDQRKDFSQRKL